MIIKTNTSGALAVPIVEQNRSVELSPGWNDIDNNDWALARKNVSRRIKSGEVVEQTKTVSLKDIPVDIPDTLRLPDEKDTGKYQIPVAISEIGNQNNKVINIIKETYHIPTLKKWLQIESTRSDVRTAIMQQIDNVNSGTIKD